MKFSRAAALVAVLSLSAPAFVHAEPAMGRVTAASEGTFLDRDGKLAPAYVNETLLSGDRILTRGNAHAKVALSGCDVSVQPASMVSVDSNSCSTAPKSFAAAEAGAGGGAFLGLSTSTAIGLGVLVAVAVTAAVASNDSSTPTSP